MDTLVWEDINISSETLAAGARALINFHVVTRLFLRQCCQWSSVFELMNDWVYFRKIRRALVFCLAHRHKHTHTHISKYNDFTRWSQVGQLDINYFNITKGWEGCGSVCGSVAVCSEASDVMRLMKAAPLIKQLVIRLLAIRLSQQKHFKKRKNLYWQRGGGSPKKKRGIRNENLNLNGIAVWQNWTVFHKQTYLHTHTHTQRHK